MLSYPEGLFQVPSLWETDKEIVDERRYRRLILLDASVLSHRKLRAMDGR